MGWAMLPGWQTLVLVVCCAAILPAQEPPPTPDLAPAEAASIQAAGELIRSLALKELPRRYENKKKWGGTKTVWDGIETSFYRLRLHTKRRTKEVNHGTWKRYEAWLIDPEQNLRVQVDNVKPAAGGGMTFDITAEGRIGAFARLAEWQFGVQLLSIGVVAEATIRVRLNCQAKTRIDVTHLPPEFVIEPTVTGADLELLDFDLVRVSDLHGPLVRELGESLRGTLQDEIDEKRPKLVAAANRQIEKNRDKLRFSVTDFANDGWQKTRDLLQKL